MVTDDHTNRYKLTWQIIKFRRCLPVIAGVNAVCGNCMCRVDNKVVRGAKKIGDTRQSVDRGYQHKSSLSRNLSPDQYAARRHNGLYVNK